VMYIKKSDGEAKAAEGEDSGEIRVVICGKTIAGDILPVLVDADGAIIVTVST